MFSDDIARFPSSVIESVRAKRDKAHSCSICPSNEVWGRGSIIAPVLVIPELNRIGGLFTLRENSISGGSLPANRGVITGGVFPKCFHCYGQYEFSDKIFVITCKRAHIAS